MSNSAIARHYGRLVSLWPKDLLRPTQQFTKAIEFRGAIYGLNPQSEPTKPAKGAKAIPKPQPLDPKKEMEHVNALYSLLENRFKNKYPIPSAVLRPQSMPDHYDILIADIEAAPKRSWLQATWDQWKNKIRWQ